MKHAKITPQIAALYFGAWCEIVKAPVNWNKHMPIVGELMEVTGQVCQDLGIWEDFEITLHLRHLNSLTDEQAMECYNIFFGGQVLDLSIGQIYELSSKILIESGKNIHLGTAAIQNHLRSLAFDLDCLIEAGLAKQIEL